MKKRKLNVMLELAQTGVTKNPELPKAVVRVQVTKGVHLMPLSTIILPVLKGYGIVQLMSR